MIPRNLVVDAKFRTFNLSNTSLVFTHLCQGKRNCAISTKRSGIQTKMSAAGIICRQSIWSRLTTNILPRLSTRTIAPSSTEIAITTSPSSYPISSTSTSTSTSPVPETSWVEWVIGRETSLRMNDIWDSLLMAVPKKRTTRTIKRKKLAAKFLRRSEMMIECEICREWKRPHFYCRPKCPGRREMGI